MTNNLESQLRDQLGRAGAGVQPPPVPLAELLSDGVRSRRRRHTRTVLLASASVALVAVAAGTIVNLQSPSTKTPLDKPTSPASHGAAALQIATQTDLATVVTPPLGPLAYASVGAAIYVTVTRGGHGESGYRLVKLDYPSLRQTASTPVGGGTVVPSTDGGVWTANAPQTNAFGPGPVGTLTEHDPDTLAVTRELQLAFGPAHGLISADTYVYTGGDNIGALDLPSGAAAWSSSLGGGSTANVVALGVSPDGSTLYDVLDTRAGAALQSRSLHTGKLIASRSGLIDGTLTPTSGGVWFSTWKAKGTSQVQLYRGPQLTPATRIAASKVRTNILPVPTGDGIWLVPTVKPGPMVCADAATGKILSTVSSPDLWPTNTLSNGQLIGFTHHGVATLTPNGRC